LVYFMLLKIKVDKGLIYARYLFLWADKNTVSFFNLITGLDLQMSCLTRKLQQQLARYIKRNNSNFSPADPEGIRAQLVSQGVCPSDVTADQVRLILQQIDTY
jgi:hypothetical protein